MSDIRAPNRDGVLAAARSVAAILPPTPLLPVEIGGVRCHVKAESLQPVGAFKIRELVREQLIRLVWAPTDRLAADLLSKNLGTAKFQQFQRYVLGLPAGKPVRTLVTRVVSSWL